MLLDLTIFAVVLVLYVIGIRKMYARARKEGFFSYGGLALFAVGPFIVAALVFFWIQSRF